MLHRYAFPAIFLLLPIAAGCVSTSKAQQYAALRSGCPGDKIKEVSQDDHDAVLNVCGVYEDWRWHGFNGWEYVGPSAEQPLAAPVDTDGDGVPDNVDACPTMAGIASLDAKLNGCPPAADADGDGIADALDACPQVAGVADPDPKKNGCPPPPPPTDTDGDGITDDVDACPDKAGMAHPDPAKNGCPDDNDGDGIKNDVDACPDTAGPANEDPKKNGCPSVIVKGDEIVITERIEFDTGKSTIKPVSNKLVDDIAKVMKEHPEILVIEIQGHTDNQGQKGYNKMLSQSRARAVKKALEKRGIEAKRMKYKGYGPDKPIASNDTKEGRQTNRRVQFKILKKDAPPTPPAPPAPPAPTPKAPPPPPPAPKP